MNVLKLGGSLLTCPDLMDRLRILFQQDRFQQPVIIPGGGAAADQVRQLQQRFCLDDRTAHWLAIDAMSENARQLCRLNGHLKLCESLRQIHDAWTQERIPVINARRCLEDAERLVQYDRFKFGVAERLQSVHVVPQPGSEAHRVDAHSGATDGPIQGRPCFVPQCLPPSWDVSSDSIAAWLAAHWSAESLWLLKSCDAPTLDPDELADRLLVDRWFPRAMSPAIESGWINLRKLSAAP